MVVTCHQSNPDHPSSKTKRNRNFWPCNRLPAAIAVTRGRRPRGGPATVPQSHPSPFHRVRFDQQAEEETDHGPCHAHYLEATGPRCNRGISVRVDPRLESFRPTGCGSLTFVEAAHNPIVERIKNIQTNLFQSPTSRSRLDLWTGITSGLA